MIPSLPAGPMPSNRLPADVLASQLAGSLLGVAYFLPPSPGAPFRSRGRALPRGLFLWAPRCRPVTKIDQGERASGTPGKLDSKTLADCPCPAAIVGGGIFSRDGTTRRRTCLIV